MKKDGLAKLKNGDIWLRMLDVLRGFFGYQDIKNKNKTLKRYLNR